MLSRAKLRSNRVRRNQPGEARWYQARTRTAQTFAAAQAKDLPSDPKKKLTLIRIELNQIEHQVTYGRSELIKNLASENGDFGLDSLRISYRLRYSLPKCLEEPQLR